MRDLENLNTLFLSLNISKDDSKEPTRSAAKRSKPENLHVCLACDTAFSSKTNFVKHLKNVHKVSAKEETAKFKEARRVYAAEPECPAARYNYRRALARVTFLEKYK